MPGWKALCPAPRAASGPGGVREEAGLDKPVRPLPGHADESLDLGVPDLPLVASLVGIRGQNAPVIGEIPRIHAAHEGDAVTEHVGAGLAKIFAVLTKPDGYPPVVW